MRELSLRLLMRELSLRLLMRELSLRLRMRGGVRVRVGGCVCVGGVSMR